MKLWSKNMETESRVFSLGTVLCLVTGRYLCRPGEETPADLAGYLNGGPCPWSTPTGMRIAVEACRPWILEQYPQLDSSDLRSRLERLDEIVSFKSNEELRSDPSEVWGWLDEVMEVYGQELELRPLPVNRRFNVATPAEVSDELKERGVPVVGDIDLSDTVSEQIAAARRLIGDASEKGLG